MDMRYKTDQQSALVRVIDGKPIPQPMMITKNISVVDLHELSLIWYCFRQAENGYYIRTLDHKNNTEIHTFYPYSYYLCQIPVWSTHHSGAFSTQEKWCEVHCHQNPSSYIFTHVGHSHLVEIPHSFQRLATCSNTRASSRASMFVWLETVNKVARIPDISHCSD